MKASTAWRLLIVTMFVCQMGWREGAAATHYVVPTNLSAANPYTNWGTAGTNIIDVVNAAMTNATTPRVVWVTNGTYALTNQVSITNAITVQGFTNNGAVVIDGQNNTRCFNLSHTNAILDGFVITRGFTNSGGECTCPPAPCKTARLSAMRVMVQDSMPGEAVLPFMLPILPMQ